MSEDAANKDASEQQSADTESDAPEAPDGGADASASSADAAAAPAAGAEGGADASTNDPTDAEQLAQEALKAAQQAVADIKSDGEGDSPDAQATESASGAQPMPLPDLASSDGADAGNAAEGIDLLADVNLDVRIELGRTTMLVEDVLRLSEGAVVELDKLAGDPVDVYVNDRHVARGEVLILNDNFCVRVNEILAGKNEFE